MPLLNSLRCMMKEVRLMHDEMTAERWNLIEELVDQTLNVPPANRDQFLNISCNNDARLRQEVETIIRRQENQKSSLNIIKLDPNELTDFLDQSIIPTDNLVIDGKYRIERALAHGGMGKIFLATHIHMERQ